MRCLCVCVFVRAHVLDVDFIIVDVVLNCLFVSDAVNGANLMPSSLFLALSLSYSRCVYVHVNACLFKKRY